MAPYTDQSTSPSPSRRGLPQHASASDSVPGRKLAQLVSKFETLDLMGSRGTSSKQKSSLRRAPLLLPGSKTMSSLFKPSPRAANSAAPRLDSMPSTPSKQKMAVSGSLQHLPVVTLYPPQDRQVAVERPRAKSTVAETRKMFESGQVAETRKARKVMRNPLRSADRNETVLFNNRQPLKPSLSSSLNYFAQHPSRNPSTSTGTKPNKMSDEIQSTPYPKRTFKLSSYHYASPQHESSTAASINDDLPSHSAYDIPSSINRHRDYVDSKSVKLGQPRIMTATKNVGSTWLPAYARLPSEAPTDAPCSERTSLVTTSETPDVSEITLFVSQRPKYSVPEEDVPQSHSSESAIAGCSTPTEEIILYQRASPTRDHLKDDSPLAPPSQKWTPQRVITPQKPTVTNDDHIEPKQGQGTFVRRQAPPTLRETIGLFESMSYGSNLSASCQATARSAKKPAAGDIKVQKRNDRGTAHQRLKGSLRNLSSTWGRKSAKREKVLDSFPDYPEMWKANSIKGKTGKSFHTQLCELSQPRSNPYVTNKDKPLYESYSNARKVWDSWARGHKDVHNGDDVGYHYTSLHASVLDPNQDQPVYVEETSSVYSTDANPAVQEAIEAARRRSRRWISRSSGTLVSQAHCRLEQPKPVHANEVKRLISLCKMRVVGHKRRGNTE